MAINIAGKGVLPSALIKANPYAGHLGQPPVGKQVVGTVHTQKTVSKQVINEGQHQEMVGTVQVPAVHAQVTVSGGRTLQTQPFENVKIMVSLTMPCAPSDIDATYEFVTDWVGNKLNDAVSGMKG